jgi:hypothetical protein
LSARKLQTVLNEFSRRLQESSRLARDAYNWSLAAPPKGQIFISESRRDSITELAFLRAFLAWETFLEKSFILYLMGQIPTHGRAPKRYVFPPNQRLAMEWLAEGRDYAKWAKPGEVSKRATRFFRKGHPFASALRSQQNELANANVIRNMIAHESTNAREKFEKLVRQKLGALPFNRTVGGFLCQTVPKTKPPTSFLEWYLSILQFCAEQIILP